jgi:hypothetical protein
LLAVDLTAADEDVFTCAEVQVECLDGVYEIAEAKKSGVQFVECSHLQVVLGQHSDIFLWNATVEELRINLAKHLPV